MLGESRERWRAYLSVGGLSQSRPAFFVNDRKRKKFPVVPVVKPSADEIVERQSGSARERQGVDHELFDGLFFVRSGFVIEDVNFADPDLENVDVAGYRR